MAEKFVARHLPGNELSSQKGRSNLVSSMLSMDTKETGKSRIDYLEVNVDDITPRSINKYRQTRIERLAKSIRNTNNRLIHPIILVRAEDLPEDNDVIKAFLRQGKKVSDLKYIIVSGERRYRSWLLLREEEAKKIDGRIGAKNIFDTITANILSKEEARKEEIFYKDANDQARQLSNREALWIVKDLLPDIKTEEQKRDALIFMNGGSEEGIDSDPHIAAKKFKAADYILYILKNEYDFEDYTEKTAKNFYTVANKCDDKVIDAILEGSFNIKRAKEITSFSRDEQIELLNVYISDGLAKYQERISELRMTEEKPKERATHADTRGVLKATLKSIENDRKKIDELVKRMDSKYSRNEQDSLRRFDAFIADLKNLIENTK